MKYSYLKKGTMRSWRRKDEAVVMINIVNNGNKRLRIRKDFDKILNNVLKRIFFDNNEYIAGEQR